MREDNLATIVLAHGGWSAAWAWKKVRPLMAAAGHHFFTPTYTGLGERAHLASRSNDLETHIQDLLGVLKFEDLRKVVLIGHSYGGMVATGVADRARDRVAQLIYLDAFVPTSGQALIDLVPPTERQRLLDSVKTGDGWRVTPNPTPPDTSPEDLEWISKYRMPRSVKCSSSNHSACKLNLVCRARTSTARAMPIKSRSLSLRAARMARLAGKPTSLTPATVQMSRHRLH